MKTGVLSVIVALVFGVLLFPGSLPAQDSSDDLLFDELSADYTEGGNREDVPDPLEGWNRAVFAFNDSLYICLLQPLAKGYGKVVPREIRQGLDNIFENLRYPIRLINSLFQGKFDRAAKETGSFLLDSTVGMLGLAEVSTEFESLSSPLPEEDTGQTLGKWGVDNGFYIVWPVLGPSTLRDTFGRVGDYFLNPLTYVNPGILSTGLKAGDRINSQSFNPDEYEELKEGALDPYTAFKDGYLQYREAQVNK
ncbi:MAG: VacJ family lipoprotein [Desulfohalobiaceae bacterium]|nr:VacJ family lipoprotein [Desulfohalobiaceae bacterium]